VRRRFATADEGELVEHLARRVADRELDPYTGADALLASIEA
jgi:hypothetical protein